jgi:hypothetical protein
MDVAQWNFTQFFGAAFACLGVYFFSHGLLRLVRRNPEASWSKVKGKIVVSEIEFSNDVYRAKIRYTYGFDGQVREGSRIAPLQAWSSFRSTAAHFVDKYPAGRDADVYVDPSDPDCSVLEQQQQPIAAIAETLLGVAAGGFGYFAWLTASI